MINSRELAKLAGVSQTTVSRCLNDNPSVSEKTRNKVMNIANKYGFVLNSQARSLKTKKTDTIGLILPRHFTSFNNNIYTSNLLSQIKHLLANKKLDLLLISEDYSEDNKFRSIKNKKVDGIIVLKHELKNEDVKWISNSIPCVFINPNPEHLKIADINAVYYDNYLTGQNVARYLIELGHKSIVTITTKDKRNSMVERTRGFRDYLESFGIKIDEKSVLYGDYSFKSGYNLVMNNLEVIKKNTAIFAQNDMMALGCIEALKSNNINVPEDISVIGHDNLDMSTWFKPELTTISRSIDEIAKVSVDLLLGKSYKKIKLETELIIRESTGIPRSHTL